MFLKIFRYNVYVGKLEKLSFSDKTIINTINPHSYVVSKNDKIFSESLVNSNYLFPDGIGIVIAAKILHNKIIKRITGADIHDHLLIKAVDKSLNIFYLGSSNKTLDLIRKKNLIKYPSLNFTYFSPPFKSKFSEDDNQTMIKKINRVKPDILFVGMTAPKQEKWVYLNKSKIDVKIIASIGAVFDFYAGTFIRPNFFIQRIGLEWAFRFLKDPKRLFRRNFISTPLFIIDLIIEKFSFFKRP